MYYAGSYGQGGIALFKKNASEEGICLAVERMLPEKADAKEYDEVFQALHKVLFVFNAPSETI